LRNPEEQEAEIAIFSSPHPHPDERERMESSSLIRRDNEQRKTAATPFQDGCDIQGEPYLTYVTHINIDIVRIVIALREPTSKNQKKEKEKTKKKINSPVRAIPYNPPFQVRLIFTGYCSNWMLPRKPEYSKAITS